MFYLFDAQHRHVATSTREPSPAMMKRLGASSFAEAGGAPPEEAVDTSALKRLLRQLLSAASDTMAYEANASRAQAIREVLNRLDHQ